MANDKDVQTATKDAASRGKSAADEATKATETTTRRAADAAKDIGEEGTKAAESATRRAADTAHEMTEEQSRTAETAARKGAEMTQESTRAGADMMRRSADTVRDTSREMTGLTLRAAEETAGRVQRLFGLTGNAQEQVANQANKNMEVMAECGSVLMDGMQSIMREWLTLAQDATQRQFDGVNTMMRSRTVQDLFSAQSDLMKDELELFLNRSVRMSELAANSAKDAAKRLNQRADEGAHQLRRTA